MMAKLFQNNLSDYSEVWFIQFTPNKAIKKLIL